MYYIVYHDRDGHYKAIIDKTGTPNKYGEKKYFKTKKAAAEWIEKKSYPYMTHYYTIEKSAE